MSSNKKKLPVVEFNELNKMCITCKCLGKSCNGTTEQVWTGCVYYKSKMNNCIGGE